MLLGGILGRVVKLRGDKGMRGKGQHTPWIIGSQWDAFCVE